MSDNQSVLSNVEGSNNERMAKTFYSVCFRTDMKSNIKNVRSAKKHSTITCKYYGTEKTLFFSNR